LNSTDANNTNYRKYFVIIATFVNSQCGLICGYLRNLRSVFPLSVLSKSKISEAKSDGTAKE